MVNPQTLFAWIDMVWVPVAFFAAHKGHRIHAVAFALACVLALRFQIELMNEIGFPRGIFKVMDTPLFTRGIVVYGVFVVLFLLMARFSKGADTFIYIAAAITVFIAAFCISSLGMVL